MKKTENRPWRILKLNERHRVCTKVCWTYSLVFTHTNVFFKHGHFEEWVTLLSPWKEAATLIRVKFLIFYCQNLYFSTFPVDVLLWSITSWIYTISQGNPSILNGIHHRGSNHGVPRCCATRVYHDGVPHLYQDGVCTLYVARNTWSPVSFTVIRFVWVSAEFGTCTVVSVIGTLVEAIMCTFILESTHCSSTNVLFTLTTVRVQNLALTHTKWITVYWAERDAGCYGWPAPDLVQLVL